MGEELLGCWCAGCASCGTVQFEVTMAIPDVPLGSAGDNTVFFGMTSATYQLYSCFAHVPKEMKIMAVREEGFQWLQGE